MNDQLQRIANLSPDQRALLIRKLGKADHGIPPIQDRASLPLSFAQQRLWFIDLWDTGSAMYNVALARHLSGLLNVGVLERCINELVRRHEALRTTFSKVNGEPMQVIAPFSAIPLPVLDMSGQTGDAARQQANVEAQTPFDLTVGPLIRARLIRMGAEEHVLVIIVHHIVFDGWSAAVMLRELSALYAAFLHGLPSPLPDLPIQYADFAVWQRHWLQGKVLDAQTGYWKKQLAAAPVMELPTDHPRPAAQSYRGACEEFSLSGALAGALGRLGRQQGATLFMTLLAAFQVLLHRYTGQPDIVVGAPIAGRNRPETAGMIGFFVNTLVLRADLSGNPTFLELLARIKAMALDAYTHQDLPFEKLVEELAPQRSLSHHPLFQVMFMLQNAVDAGLTLEGLSATPVKLESHSAKFDLTLSLAETSAGMEGMIEYSTDLFDAPTIARMALHFQTLVEGIAANPQARLSELPLLTPIERQKLLVEWNDTARDYPLDLCVHQLFEAQVERTPDAVAVDYEGEQLTYAELNARANRLAQHLRGLGVAAEMLVAICVERSPEMVVGLLGVMKAGAAYVPLDPDYPQERLAFMLSDSAASVVLTQARLLQRLPQSAAIRVCLDDDWPQIMRQPDHAPASVVTPRNLAYVIYTSGSTGVPKGVAIEHRSIAGHCYTMREHFQLSAADRVFQFASFSFDASIEQILPPLSVGAAVVLGRHQLKEPAELDAGIRNGRLTVLNIPPALFRHWVRLYSAGNPPPQTLRLIILGGDVLAREAVMAWRALPDATARLVNAYGPTEATITSTLYRIPDAPDSGGIPIGRPINNTCVYVLDRHLQPAPAGVPGELYIGGIGVARGYLNRPQLTAQRFVPNPFGNAGADRLYRSGDLVRYRADGNIEFLGRIDHQVKLRGFRIEPGEIEAVLRQFPGVRDAAVLAREDSPGDQRLVAYMASSPDAVPSPAALREFLLQKLPDHMVPAAYVMLDRLPLTASGKLDRMALPAPDAESLARTQGYVAPANAVEQTLCDIWAEEMNVEQVGIHDNFFELGGHSLLAAQVVSRIRDVFRRELSLRTFFEMPTVAQLAGCLADGAPDAPTGILPIGCAPRDMALPLSFAQQRLWFIDQMDPGSAMYNVPRVYRLSGLLKVGAWEHSINELVQRHESLRTTFRVVDGEPTQVIAPFSAAPLPVQDMRGLTEAEVWQQVSLEVQTPFDLAAGPLFRTRLICLEAEEHVLVLNFHHIVFDGWSMGVLLRELSALYAAGRHGLKSPLPALPIQYADYAAWQRQWLKGGVLDAQSGYWKKQLAGAPVIELPTDRPRPVAQSHRGASMEINLSAALTRRLNRLGRQQGATLFMTLLAAFQVLLHRYTGQEDIVVGAPTAGRNRSEIAGLIGFFVNTLVLRGDLSGDPTFLDLLARIRDMAREAYNHQDLPFEKLVSELAPQRSLSHHPLFQIMFVLQNQSKIELKLDGLSATLVRLESSTAKFDLLLSLTEVSAGMRGAIEYSTDLFDASTIARMVLHFQTLLEGIAENPQARLSELPLLTAAERRQLLVEWNDTARDYPRDLCVHQLFEAQVERAPDAVALVHDGQPLTYAELNARANRLAHALIAHGVSADAPVAIALERSPAMIVALLATLKAGGAYVPLDPDYPADPLAFMLEDSGASMLITQERLRQRMSLTVKHTLCLDTGAAGIAQQPALNPACPVAPAHLAYIIYTSGSTGKPKGVAMPHAPLCNLIAWQLQNTPQVRANTLQYTTLSFDVSFQEIFCTLSAGGCLFLIDNDARRDGHALLRFIQAHQIGRLFMPFVALANLSEIAAQSGVIPDTLRCVFTAGEQLRITPAISYLFEKTGASLHNHYGPTECHVVTAFDLGSDVARWPSQPPIGRPIANTRLYVLDRYRHPVPIGVPGELHIGGDGLARGYLNRPDLTADKFIADPFSSEAGARLYQTGDRVRYLPDGNIEFLGRLDQQVKISGFRVEPGEIEATLLQHPAVLDAVAQARDADSGGKVLVAFIVKKPDASPTLHELRHFLGQHLPAHLVPGRLFLVNRLPLNANGKVDRSALMNTPLPNKATQASRVPPYNALQATLLQIWSGLLEIPEIGINENFFELGGDSYAAVTMLYRVEKLTRWPVPLATIYNHPTVEALAQAMLEHKGEYQRSPLVEIQAGASGPPFFFMHGDFHGGGFYCYQLARFMGPGQAFYAIQPHGLPGRPVPTTIEDMAAEYLALIRAAFPQGPYFLGGHCNGALVAFEMAQRLLAEGSKVELLVMMDPSPVQGKVVSSPTSSLRSAMGLPRNATTNFDLDKLTPGDRHDTVMQLYWEICMNYAPKFYPGKLTLFLAKDNLASADPAHGWRNMSATGELHVVPGNHISMLTVNAPALARKLMECRSKATWN